jgi:hypothetical protein
VVRKSSDIAMLLGSRGRARPRGGVGQSIRSVFDSWLGRPARRDERPRASVPSWLALVGVLAAFAVGFFTGGRLGIQPADQASQLDAKPQGGKRPGNEPTLLDANEVEPLHSTCFVVAFYENVSDAIGRAQAKALSDWLRQQQLPTARPYLIQSRIGPVWSVCVYFDGPSQQASVRERLLALPVEGVPDLVFVQLRKTDPEWPKDWVVQ